MIDNNFVDAVIQLPSDLFFGTSIATCVLVLKKNKSDNNILFVDATEECVRNTNKNKLSDGNIDNIVNIIKNRKSIDGKSYLATYDEIKENDFNISVNTYLKNTGEETIINIKEINEKLAQLVPKQQIVRDELEAIIKELEVDYNE